MTAAMAVCKREFKAYFLTSIGYVIVSIVAVLCGLSFSLQFLEYAQISQDPTTYGYATVPDFEEYLLSPFLVFCGVLLMFLSPLITMRLLAEEKNRGTMELLLTQPLRDRDIIFGKYAAALAMVGVMLLIISIDLAVVAYFTNVEPAVLVLGLLTVFLMGAAFISLGLFVSAITANQITSGAITFGLSLVLFILGNVGQDLPAENPAPAGWPEALRNGIGAVYNVFRGFLQEMAVDAHAREMAQGILQPQDILYYILFSAFFLFLTFRALESRNWRS